MACLSFHKLHHPLLHLGGDVIAVFETAFEDG